MVEWFRRECAQSGAVDVSAATMHRWLKDGVPSDHRVPVELVVDRLAEDARTVLEKRIADL